MKGSWEWAHWIYSAYPRRAEGARWKSMKDEKPIPMPVYRDPATGLTDEEAGIVGTESPWSPVR